MNRIPNQHGSALIVGLVVLLVLTVISTTGMQTTALEEKMAGNARSRDLAFQAAESALRAGEAMLKSQAGQITKDQFGCGGTSGQYLSNCFPPSTVWDWLTAQNAWGQSAAAVQYPGNLAHIDTSQKPSYVIEALPVRDTVEVGTDHPDTLLFRVTAHGVGNTTDAVAIVQSIYRP